MKKSITILKYPLLLLFCILQQTACVKTDNKLTIYKKKANRGWFSIHIGDRTFIDTIFSDVNSGNVASGDGFVTIDTGDVASKTFIISCSVDSFASVLISGQKLNTSTITGVYNTASLTGNFYWVPVGSFSATEYYNGTTISYAAWQLDADTANNNITVNEFSSAGKVNHFKGSYKTRAVSPDTTLIWGEFDIKN